MGDGDTFRLSELSLLSQYAAGGSQVATGGADRYAILAANIGELADYLLALARRYEDLRVAHNSLVARFNELLLFGPVMPRLHVTEQLIIPVE